MPMRYQLTARIVKYQRYEYYLFNKPSGCVSATCDNVHDTVMDYITDAVHDDLFPVGRLDMTRRGFCLSQMMERFRTSS